MICDPRSITDGVIAHCLKNDKYYEVIGNNATMKQPDGTWHRCVVYSPCYENEYDTFVKPLELFMKEFELLPSYLNAEPLITNH